MARPKKPAEDKPKEGAGITIDVNDYVRTRDQVRHSFHFPPSSPCLSATTGSTAPPSIAVAINIQPQHHRHASYRQLRHRRV